MHHTASRPSLPARESTVPRTAYRRTRLAIAALLGLGACTSDAGDPTPLHLIFEAPVQLPAPVAFQAEHVVPDAAAPTLTVPPLQDDLGAVQEVYWTAHAPHSALQLASAWGLKSNVLTDLNPDLNPLEMLPTGTKLLVYKYDPDHPPQSIGSPNRGKLRNGMPLPEGDAWRLRPMRRRAYGTHTTVTTLVDAFEAYGQAFPDGPKIRVGELAKRTGGRVAPHASHRSGRDVDIGYIAHGEDNGEDRWRHMNDRNFDAEKNWLLISEILKSGNVQTIYIGRKLQKLLHKEAAKTLSPQELNEMFEYPRSSASAHAKIQHWRGHADHMHVRFKCEPGNHRCRSRG